LKFPIILLFDFASY